MWGIWAALLVAASLNDLRWRRLPNGLLVASGVLALGFQGARMWGDPLVLAVASAPLGPALWGVLPHPAVCTGSALVFLGAASALELACRHRNISLMGLGDIKLLACLTAAAGPLVGFWAFGLWCRGNGGSYRQENPLCCRPLDLCRLRPCVVVGHGGRTSMS